MLSKKEFIELITSFQEWDKQVDEVSKVLGIPVFDSPIINYAHKIFSMHIYHLFDEEGIDTLDWWLYEKSFNPSLYMEDKDGKRIPTDTLNDIWELVKNHQKQNFNLNFFGF